MAPHDSGAPLLSPLTTVTVPRSETLPFKVLLKLPPLCHYEPPLDLPGPGGNSTDLGDIAVHDAAGAVWLPTGALDARKISRGQDLRAMVADLDQDIQVTDQRHFKHTWGDEWRVRINSRIHASGGEHWVLALRPARSKLVYRLDWDNTHLWSYPGHRNPVFEKVSDHITLEKSDASA